MSGEGFLLAICVGAVAGWLVELLAKGRGLGAFGNMTMAIFGAIVGGALLPLTGLHPGPGAVGDIVDAGLGAAFLLFLVKIMRAEDKDGDGKPNIGLR